MRKIVLKLGTNSQTNKDGELDYSVTERLAKVSSGLFDRGILPVLVISGAVAAGMKMDGIKERPSHTGLLQILSGKGSRALWNMYAEAFAKYNLETIYTGVTYHSFTAEHARENLNAGIELAAQRRIITLWNTADMLTNEQLIRNDDHPLKFSDNDPMAVLLACAIRAKDIYFYTDAGKMGTGGAYSKIAAIEKARKEGIRIEIKSIKDLESSLSAFGKV